jgi:hypothetical protein
VLTVDRIAAFFARVAERSVYPIIRWTQRFRRKRIIASLLVVFAVVGSIYSYADAVYQFVNKTLVAVGLDSATNRERRISLYRSYQLGKSLAQNITYAYRRDHGEKSDLMESQIISTAAITNRAGRTYQQEARRHADHAEGAAALDGRGGPRVSRWFALRAYSNIAMAGRHWFPSDSA